jgi:hypothetical protein
MKSVKATALVFFLAMGAASVVLGANAQPPSLNQTTQAEGRNSGKGAARMGSSGMDCHT